MYGLASDISRCTDIKLGVAAVYSGPDFVSFSSGNICYFLIPQRKIWKDRGEVAQHWQQIVMEFVPDLVHIHGTEFDHGMALMQTTSSLKFVVSIQGLVSVCYRYYLAGLSLWDVITNITFRDLVRRDSLFQARWKFHKRGLVEVDYIKKADAIVGRTDWDFSHVNAIRPGVPYYFCNECLRNEFYSDLAWDLQSCRSHSILLSQAGYPIKGFHQLIKAVALLVAEFPDIRIEIAGPNIAIAETWSQRLRLGGYGRYIRRLLDRLDLWPHVRFLGPLGAIDMRNAYLRAHVFVCPSSIENSPNSLGEAQILGVPSVAAYCGGIPSMVESGESALLYPFEEYEMLADSLRQIFSNNGLATKLSLKGMQEAKRRHDRSKNTADMISIYRYVTGDIKLMTKIEQVVK